MSAAVYTLAHISMGFINTHKRVVMDGFIVPTQHTHNLYGIKSSDEACKFAHINNATTK